MTSSFSYWMESVAMEIFAQYCLNASGRCSLHKTVLKNYYKVLEYVAELYVDTVNIIHYMHDKYAYEASQMALHLSLIHISSG